MPKPKAVISEEPNADEIIRHAEQVLAESKYGDMTPPPSVVEQPLKKGVLARALTEVLSWLVKSPEKTVKRGIRDNIETGRDFGLSWGPNAWGNTDEAARAYLRKKKEEK
jgi:hypothetical protein